jgi:hypothetical protein
MRSFDPEEAAPPSAKPTAGWGEPPGTGGGRAGGRQTAAFRCATQSVGAKGREGDITRYVAAQRGDRRARRGATAHLAAISCRASGPGGTSDKRAFIGCAEQSGFAPFGALLICARRRLPDAWAGGGDLTAGLAARQRRKPHRFDRSRDPVGCGRVAHGGRSQSSSSLASAAKRENSSARAAAGLAIAAPASSSSSAADRGIGSELALGGSCSTSLSSPTCGSSPEP